MLNDKTIIFMFSGISCIYATDDKVAPISFSPVVSEPFFSCRKHSLIEDPQPQTHPSRYIKPHWLTWKKLEEAASKGKDS